MINLKLPVDCDWCAKWIDGGTDATGLIQLVGPLNRNRFIPVLRKMRQVALGQRAHLLDGAQKPCVPQSLLDDYAEAYLNLRNALSVANCSITPNRAWPFIADDPKGESRGYPIIPAEHVESDDEAKESAALNDPKNWVDAKWLDKNLHERSAGIRAAIQNGARIRVEPRGRRFSGVKLRGNMYFLPDVNAHFGRRSHEKSR
jgi:hypothetical protein